MIRLMKNKKGASSILVILLLVVLVVFGVAALTTALSNVRLGQKVVDWNEKYYAAEAQANEMYAEIDKAVWLAQLSPLSIGVSEEVIANSVEELDFDVKASINDAAIDFTYEVWQEDVGILVTLTLSTNSNELTVAKWRALQK